MNIRPANLTETKLLAAFSQSLRLENDNQEIISIEQLEAEIREALANGYKAYIFEVEGVIPGYALVNNAMESPVIMQFYVSKQYRCKGYGMLAYKSLQKLIGQPTLKTEVCERSAPGNPFWSALGLNPQVSRKSLEGSL